MFEFHIAYICCLATFSSLLPGVDQEMECLTSVVNPESPPGYLMS